MVDRFDRIWDMVADAPERSVGDLASRIRRRWRVEGTDAVGVAPTFAGGRLYLGDGEELVVLDAGSGEVSHRIRLPGPLAAPPVIQDAVAYCRTGVDGDTVVAVDPTTGTERWRVDDASWRRHGDRPYDTGADLAIGDGRCYLAGANGKVVALATDAGSIEWTARIADEVTGAPATDGERVYLGTGDGYVAALSAATGSGRWRVQTGDQVSAVTVVDGDRRIYASCTARTEGNRLFGRVWALAPDTGHASWTFDADGPVDHRVVRSGGVVVLTDCVGLLYGVYDETGEGLWARHLGPEPSRPSADDGVVYACTVDGRAHGVDAPSGTQEWIYEGSGEGPALAPIVDDGVVFAVDPAGTVSALTPGPDRDRESRPDGIPE